MDLHELKKSNCIIFECISGSKAYGLSIEGSDEDIRGVFIAPKKTFYSFSFPEQIHDEKQNIIYYELRKFLDLLSKNNPNMLELLGIPQDCILFKHPLYEKIKAQFFLSMLCKDTFLNYSLGQFKKSVNLNKKILNPLEKAKKSPLDFCYVLQGHGSVPLSDFLKENKLSEKNCGLCLIPHMRDLYSIFYDATGSYRGILQQDNSMKLALSSISKGKSPIAILSFNQEGYSTYCKNYKEYWEWVEKRNQNRFQNTLEQGKNYDSKNMMHLFRLLDLARSIGAKGELLLRSAEREQLLKIRHGEFSYQELEEKMHGQAQEIEVIFEASNLPEKPDSAFINHLLIEIRSEFYRGN